MSYTLFDLFIDSPCLFISPSGLRLSISSKQSDILGDKCNNFHIKSILDSSSFEYIFLHIDSFSICFIDPCLFKNSHKLILILGDTHHGPKPLTYLCNWIISSNVKRIINYSCPHHDELISLFTGIECVYFPAIFGVKFWLKPHSSPSSKIVHIGNISSHHIRRTLILANLANSSVNVDILQVHGYQMNLRLNQSIVSINCSLNCDISHRVSESLAAGTLVVTDRLTKYQKFLQHLADENIISLYSFNKPSQLIDVLLMLEDLHTSPSGRNELFARKNKSQREFRNILRKFSFYEAAAKYITLKAVELPFILRPFTSNFDRPLTWNDLEFYEACQEKHRLNELNDVFKLNLSYNQKILLQRLCGFIF